MRYLALLYADERDMPPPGTPEWDADLAGYAAFDGIAGSAIVAGEAFEPNERCRTIRATPSGLEVTAGPYAETTEALGGLYVLEAPTLDDVIELVRHLPAAQQGGVEIRPMVEWVELDGAPEGAPAGSVPAGSVPAGPVHAARYLATIHGPETEAETPGSAEWDAGAAEHGRFAEGAASLLWAAGAVHPTPMASTVRVRDGELLVTDGPYAEAMEVVGGFYVLRGPDDLVVAAAGRIPVPAGGAVELRPVVEFDA